MIETSKKMMKLSALLGLGFLLAFPAQGQESKRRWEQLCQIRKDKFDITLPAAMRDNNIDMWIITMREGLFDPNNKYLGDGKTGDVGYYIFTDKGEGRIERATIGVFDHMLAQCDTYDILGAREGLKAFVEARDPKRIGLNMSKNFGTADGLSHTLYLELVETLGPKYSARFTSAEKLVSEFRTSNLPSEVALFAQTAELSRNILERALSNEVIIPDVTTTADVSWWIRDRMLEKGLESSFGTPSVSKRGPVPGGHSNDTIIRRGDLLSIDYGIGYQNQWTDMKRLAYILKEGESQVPEGMQAGFDKALTIRKMITDTIKPGLTAAEALEKINNTLIEMDGVGLTSYQKTSEDLNVVDVVVGSHSVGDLGHGSGPSLAPWNAERMTYKLRPGNLLSIEFFAYVHVPEYGSRKTTFGLEDNAVVTDTGVQFLAPPGDKILIVK